MSSTTTTDAEYAARAVALHGDACLLLSAAYRKVQDLGAKRAQQKMDAVERLMAEKSWPISRAENFAQLDVHYDDFKRQCDSADLARLTAALNVENAALAARFHIARLEQHDTEDVAGMIQTMRADLKAGVLE